MLVQQPDGQADGGAACFAGLDVSSWAPLIEVAPQHETVFSIFYWAWMKGSPAAPVGLMRAKIDDAFRLFISSFKGCNSVPLLDFITLILNNLNPAVSASDPDVSFRIKQAQRIAVFESDAASPHSKALIADFLGLAAQAAQS